jgi:chlorite dismutase
MTAINQNKTTLFVGDANVGEWKVISTQTIVGEAIPNSLYLTIIKPTNEQPQIENFDWMLKGFNSNLRYTNREEKNILDTNPSVLGNPDHTSACFIPIKKTETWWNLTQDERRAIMERSRHIDIGFDYLSVINRQLFHSRDLGETFDFLTWFEFKPEHASKFNDLLTALRNTEEWKYIDREVEVRLVKA